jgi:hypothetical protein
MRTDKESRKSTHTLSLCCLSLLLALCADPAGNTARDPGLPPEAPAAIRILRDDRTLIIKWDAVEGVDSYEVYCSYYTDPEKAELLGTFRSCRAEATKLLNGVTYHVWVKSINNAGRSGWSSGAEGTPAVPPLPAAPLVHAPEEAGGATLIRWDSAEDAVRYEVRYGAVANPAEANSNAVIITEDTYCVIEGLAAGAFVWVRSLNSQGGSKRSLHWEGRCSSLAALAEWLGGSAANTIAAPYRLGLDGVDLSRMGGGSNGMGPLFATFQGRYLALDLDACTGATIGWGSSSAQTSANRPDKDKLVAVTLPSSAATRRVGRNAFEHCVNLVSVTFSPRLIEVADNAFRGCVSLAQADLPATLAHIWPNAFSGCAKLKTLIVRASAPPMLDGSAFNGCPADLLIRVPADSVSLYQSSNWNRFAIAALEEGE